MPDEDAMLMQVAILGTDALIAARPVDAVQLWRACQNLGFDFVAPVSWGEELVACSHAARMVDLGSTAVIASCPLVDNRLNEWPVRPPVLKTVAPPVACARYVRAAFHPRSVHITYVGTCAGALSAEIDVHVTPDVLFARFIEAGVDLATQPRHFDGQIPPERARYASLPGGAPSAEWLAQRGVRLIEAALFTVDTVVAQTSRESVLIDLAASCSCRCARARIGAERVEPSRTFVPVVMNLQVPVADGETAPEPDPVMAQRSEPDSAPAPRLVTDREHRARFAENGLSAGEADPIPPAPIPDSLATTLEPW